MIDDMKQDVPNCIRKWMSLRSQIVNHCSKIRVLNNFQGSAEIIAVYRFKKVYRIDSPNVVQGFQAINPAVPNVMRVENMVENFDASLGELFFRSLNLRRQSLVIMMVVFK